MASRSRSRLVIFALLMAGVFAGPECDKACKDCMDDDPTTFVALYPVGNNGQGIGKCVSTCNHHDDSGGPFDCNHCIQPNPCQNGGHCTAILDGYSCSCVAGWTGQTCGTDIDECSSVPCQNGGSCINQLNSYSCSCVQGWTGQTCGTETCSTITVQQETRITSPNYPDDYDNNECVNTIITAPPGHVVKLTFVHFELEGHYACVFDSLDVRNGNMVSSPLLGSFCSTGTPGEIMSTGQSLFLTFTTDFSVVYSGYAADVTFI